MAENSGIEWTDHTINFWWGCSKVSPACANCYAETRDKQFHPAHLDGNHGLPLVASHWGPNAPRLLRVEAARWEALRYEKRAVATGSRFRVFTNSMSDFFEDRRDLDLARLEALDTIRLTPHLDWLLLTKRPEKIMDLLCAAEDMAWHGRSVEDDPHLGHWVSGWLNGKPPANVWLGTTVEDQERADQRIPALLQVPAAVRFLSCEPLLGPVDLNPLTCHDCGGHEVSWGDPGSQPWCSECDSEMGNSGWLEPDGIHWVIAGGESGPHARPMHPDWARGLRDQCAEAGVPFLFKQWGSMEPIGTVDGRQVLPFADYVLPGTPGAPSGGFGFRKVAGKGHRLLDGVLHNAFPSPL